MKVLQNMHEFQLKQKNFASHIRNPEKFEAPQDVEERRLKIYRDLFFNNIENFIAGAFPVFKTLFEPGDWKLLVRDFMENHQCQTPYFLEISEEFLAYLENPELALHQAFPFANELTHYEWVELALDIADEKLPENIDPNGDLLEQLPVISAVAWPLVYQWPVHLIGRNHIPRSPSDTPVCLVVYRNRQDKVEFMEANPVTIRLLEIINSGEVTNGKSALKQIASEMGQDDHQAIIGFGLEILEKLRAVGILLGTQSS